MTKQNESHDWLADAAEALVRYLFARSKFEVFGAGKWGSDAAVNVGRTKRWYRIEVRSTDGKTWPRTPTPQKMRKCEVLAKVKFSHLKTLAIRKKFATMKTPAIMAEFCIAPKNKSQGITVKIKKTNRISLK